MALTIEDGVQPENKIEEITSLHELAKLSGHNLSEEYQTAVIDRAGELIAQNQAQPFSEENPNITETRDELRNTPIHLAVKFGSPQMLRFLLTKMSDTALHLRNSIGKTPNMVARSWVMHLENINIMDEVLQTKCPMEQASLFKVKTVHEEINETSAQCYGQSSLRLWGEEGQFIQRVKYTLQNEGTDINAFGQSSYEHYTALHFAIHFGSAMSVRVLLENGADPTLKTNEVEGGQTPLELAKRYHREGTDNIIVLLEQALALKKEGKVMAPKEERKEEESMQFNQSGKGGPQLFANSSDDKFENGEEETDELLEGQAEEDTNSAKSSRVCCGFGLPSFMSSFMS